MRCFLRPLTRSNLVQFAFVGIVVATAGHFLLRWLIGIGGGPALANAAVTAITLQLNFAGSRAITWRRRVAGSRVSGWRRWWRFHMARGASAATCVMAFPWLAPVLGATGAYWALVGAAAGINYGSDRIWSFAPDRTSRRVRMALAGLAAICLTVAAVLWLDAFLVVVSLFMLTVAATTLVFQLYKWWRPENNDPGRYGEPDEPCLPGVILVPMRHEEAVAGQTLERLATLNHPDYWVMPIVDHPDDPHTARIAHGVALDYPDRVLVCPYPEDTSVHNKPIGLNAALELLQELGIRYEWVGIADAEDLFHPDLLRLVDYRFRAVGADIVQCGVQLMNFSAHPDAVPVPRGPLGRLRRWCKSHGSGWWRAINVLEYFKWFQSRLKLQAASGVMPLGGNTVFFRREFLDALKARYGTWWDETCLTEDCKIGILASVQQSKIDVVYVDDMVTREETPESLVGLVRQRVRWMQGFIQVFAEREWLRLPTLRQRILAVYVLGFQYFQAFTATFAPIALAIALFHKSPVVIALLATIPLGLGTLSVLLDIVLLFQFGRTFGQKVRLRDYAGLILGAYPYQLVLSVAAFWALGRHVLGRTNWIKTRHLGAHLEAVAPRRPVPVGASR